MSTNCGTMEHTDDCLCDVIITKPTPINYGLADHWLLHMVAKHFEMSIPFSNADLAFLLQKSEEYLEVYMPQRYKLNLPSFPHRDNCEIPARYWQRMREHIANVVRLCDGRILPSEVCEQMELSEHEFIDGLSCHKSNGTITVGLMDKMVYEMRQGKSFTSFAKENGMSTKLRGITALLRNTMVLPYMGQPLTAGD